jgi:hypothetical protein
MYTLTSDTLEVQILDPVADQERFGTRYCTGGYIFQVIDARQGELLTGPTYPESFNWFDGQGIPDAFNLGPLRDPDGSGTLALILGVGICDLASDQVVDFCEWDVEAAPNGIQMKTTHDYGGFVMSIERSVSLRGRTIHSATRVHNGGTRLTPIRWFPHPFYPQPATDELCRFNLPVSMPFNQGYTITESGFVARAAWPDQKGFYQALDHDGRAPLTVLQRHPILGLVAAICSYTPTFFPIWGNQHTFSWEPFYERTLAPGQSTNWSIAYLF